MGITVILTGLEFRDGQRRKEMDIPEKSSVEDALDHIENTLPEGVLDDKIRMLVVLLNRKHTRMDAMLREGDELRLLCAITGG